MPNIIDTIEKFCNSEEMKALQAAYWNVWITCNLAFIEYVSDAHQQAIDDRETLSEMRALVYGEGW